MMNRLFAVVALVCATTASLKAQGLVPEWYTQGDNYIQPVEQFTENNFTMAVMVTIDGVRCDSAYEIGVYCGDECRLSAPLYASKELYEYFYFYATLTVNGVSGENFSFRLYDHRNKAEVVAEVCPDEIGFVSNKHYGSFNTGLHELAFAKSTSHRTGLEIADAADLPFTGKQYSITSEGMACSYTREVCLDGEYETIVLPFDADISEIKALGVVFERFEGFGDNTIKFVELDEGENLKAGVPYIFRYSGTPSNDREEIVFSGRPQQVNDAIVTNEGWTGTFKRMSGSEIEGHYILNIEGSMMQMASEKAWLDPYHAYLDLSESIDVSTLSVSHRSATTNVDEVLQENVCDEEIMFDLSGKRVKNPSAGDVIIKNNKKIYIR